MNFGVEALEETVPQLEFYTEFHQQLSDTSKEHYIKKSRR